MGRVFDWFVLAFLAGLAVLVTVGAVASWWMAPWWEASFYTATWFVAFGLIARDIRANGLL